MQRYAEKAMQQHMKSLQHAFYTHLGKQEPWDKEKNLLDNAIRESEVYKNLKRQGLGEKAILAAMNEKKPMTIYSTYQGETEMQMSSIDSIKHYLKILQPGMIAVEPQSGKIKVWIGGLDFKYFQYDQVLAPRQVGSVFKPVVYSAAIEHGARVDAYYNNEQKSYPEYDNWTPRNSNNQYGGYYTLKGALSQSINTIAVQVLLQTGIDATIEHAHRLGIQSDLPAVPSIALGACQYSSSGNDSPLLVLCKQWRIDNALLSAFHKRPGRTHSLRVRTTTQGTGDPGRAGSYHVFHAFRCYSRRNREKTDQQLRVEHTPSRKNRDNPESSRWLVYWL